MQTHDQQSISNTRALVDRLREQAELRAGVDSALAGRGCLFTIAGDAGIGKSRLADEVASYASSQGAVTLWGRCLEGGGAPAYWPWVQIVRGLIDRTAPTVVSDWMGGGAADIGQMVPELRSRMGGLPELPSAALAQPEQARFRLFDSTVSFVRKAAATQPLLIVLDDLHAADPTSLLLLIALSREIRNTRAMVIGTYRELEMKHSTERAALIAEAEREGVLFPLRGFSETDICQFVERSWGVSVHGALVNLLLDTTEGNPFFLSEILRLMAAEGQLAGEISALPRKLRIPSGVSESIKRLMAPLGKETQDVLSIASVIGREFDLNCLEGASQLPREQLIELLDRAAAHELINEVTGEGIRFAFRHALIREALYEGLSPTRRRTLHRMVAGTIRGSGDSGQPVAEIAYHYCQGAPLGDAELAVQYSREAARTAEKQLAYEEAAHHLGKALEMLALQRGADELLRAELLCELGEVQTKTEDFAAARKTCLKAADLARKLKQAELFARAVVAAGRGVSNSGVTDRALVALLTEAIELLGGADSPIRAQVMARLGMELYWSEREQAVMLCERAVDVARRADDQHTTIIALWARHLSLRNPDSLEQRLADTREVIDIAERAGERDFALEARFYRIADLLEAGDIAGADLEQREYLDAEAELRDRFKRGLLLQSMRALMDGRLGESDSLAQQAFAAGQQSGRPLAFNSYLIQHGNTLWELGKLGELEASLRAFIAQNPLIVFARCGLLLSLIQLGRLAEARIEFENLAKDEFSLVPRDWNWLPSMFVLAEVCADLGEKNHAATLYRQLLPYASHNAMLGYVYSYGSIGLVLGRLATLRRHFEDAENHFEMALAANRKVRATLWIAHTEFEFARMLLARGNAADRGRVRELLDSARRTANAFEAARLQEKIRSVEAATAHAPLDALDKITVETIAAPSELRAETAVDGTVTLLFSDIEDSTAIYENLGDLRGQEVVRIHNQLIREQVAAHKGFEVKAMGDGFMIAFSSARRALLCAIAAQRAFATYSESHPEQQFRVRMGLHVGEAINESSDFFGKAVILAARIAAVARGGQILVSSTLRDVAANAGDLRFQPAGEREFKGLAGTHRIYEVIW